MYSDCMAAKSRTTVSLQYMKELKSRQEGRERETERLRETEIEREREIERMRPWQMQRFKPTNAVLILGLR